MFIIKQNSDGTCTVGDIILSRGCSVKAKKHTGIIVISQNGNSVYDELDYKNIKVYDKADQVKADGSSDTLEDVAKAISEAVNFDLGSKALQVPHYEKYSLLPSSEVENQLAIVYKPTKNLVGYITKKSGLYRNVKQSDGTYTWEFIQKEQFDLFVTKDKHGAPLHDPAQNYYEPNLIYKDGKLYRCKADISAKAFDADDWEEIGGGASLPDGETILSVESAEDVVQFKPKNKEFIKDSDGKITHFYKGFRTFTDWYIESYEKSSDTTTTAKSTDNPSYDYDDAWTNRTTLTYV